MKNYRITPIKPLVGNENRDASNSASVKINGATTAEGKIEFIISVSRYYKTVLFLWYILQIFKHLIKLVEIYY